MLADEFYQSRKKDWEELTHLLDLSQAGLGRLSPEQVQTLGNLYRSATSDLALAQREFPRSPVTQFLNGLVARAHAAVYRSEPVALSRLWEFVRRGYPRAYRKALPFTLAATLLFVLPALAAGLSTLLSPASARWLLPESAQSLIPMIEDQQLWVDIPVGERPYTSTFIMQNNIQVAFMAFAGGVLGGALTVYAMLMNGLVLGGLTGLTAHYGVGFELWTFVIGHGVVELSVIFLAGGSGLMIGWAILHPGLLRRRDALVLAARRSVTLVAGFVPLLVFAGLVEGFISPAENIPPVVKWVVGLGSGALLYAYLLLCGREPWNIRVRRAELTQPR